jgi:hypothetical protein
MILHVLWFGAGAVCAGWSVESIRLTVARLNPAAGAAVAAWIAAGRTIRLAAAGLLLLGAVRAGWTCGLAAAAGYWLAGRAALAREIRRA